MNTNVEVTMRCPHACSLPCSVCEKSEAAAEIRRLRAALREIAIGKTLADTGHPLGSYAGTAFRLHKIAMRALLQCSTHPRKDTP